MQAPPVVVVCALEASSCSHGHGKLTLVSHVQQGLVEERKILKFGDYTSGDFRDFSMRKRPLSSESEIWPNGYAMKRESFNPRERERERVSFEC